MKQIFGAIAILLVPYCATMSAQTRPDQMPQIVLQDNGRWTDRIRNPYRARFVPPVDFANSTRVDSLIRAGQLYLSLQDAIALAIENNLDIELQRFSPRVAEAEILRAQGGGILRGLPLTIRQLPQGVGGPGAPLLTTVGGTAPATSALGNAADLAFITAQSTDLSIQGVTPFATGPPIPVYDPSIAGLLNWAHQSTPQTSSFVTGTSALIANTTTGNLGIQKAFATGTAVNLGFNNNRQISNAARSQYNPYTTGSLGLTVTQPLLQGFSVAVNRRFIRIAKNEERISDFIFRQQLLETVSGVIRLYWDLVSLEEDVKVKSQALGLSQKLYEDNKSQVEVGTLAPLELKRAQAEVARSRQDLTNSESLALQQELLLKNILTRSRVMDSALRAARIIPLDRIQIPANEQPQPVQDLVGQALNTRPDLAQARIQIESSQISLQGSRNALLPTLDLIGSVQNNGLTGQPNMIQQPTAGGTPLISSADPFFVGGYGNALGQIVSRNFPNYAIGVQLNIPLHNRVAQADVIRDELQVRQTEVRLRQLENQVRLEVENAVVALDRARASYNAAVETRQLQEEALAAEQERYSVGASTSFFVIQYQRDLAQARSTEVATQGNYAKARAALDRAIGATLADNNVEVDDAYHGRVNRPATPLPVLP
ncbi:MAG: TolC family protein [Acidobacteriota bacterium]|nr:TolC family protein [Acidobacteriota bacterium]